ncbi:hypothetical protein ACQZV8_20385, partial [Magnetococcales bacterium HHB-1]
GGMITLSNESDLDVSSVTVAVNRVDRTGNQSAINENLTGLNTTLESSLSTDTNNTEYLHLQSKDGSITIDEKMTLTGGGGAELRLYALGDNSDVIINTDLDGGSAETTIFAGRDFSLTQGSDLTLNSDNAIENKGSLSITSKTGAIILSDGSTITTAGEDLFMDAVKDITITGIDVGVGAVLLHSESGQIIDAGDTNTDIIASNIQLLAKGIGTAQNALDIATDYLTASVDEGGLYVDEQDALTVSNQSSGVMRYTLDENGQKRETGWIEARDINALSGGAIALTTGGSLTLDEQLGAEGAGNITLTMNGDDLTIKRDIKSGEGSINLISAKNISQSSNSEITTTGNTITLTATAGDIIQDTGSSIAVMGNSDTGEITLNAGNDIQVSSLDAGIWIGTEAELNSSSYKTTGVSSKGDISLKAGGAITATDTLSWDERTIIADLLTMQAGSEIKDLMLAINQLDAIATTGAIQLYAQDSQGETSAGIIIDQLKSAQGAASLTTQEAITVNSAEAATDLYLISKSGDITINKPTSGDAITAAEKIILKSAGDITTYDLFQGTKESNYQAGGALTFFETVTLSTITSETLVLDTKDSVTLDVDLNGVQSATLTSQGGVSLTGDLLNVGQLSITATGEVSQATDTGTVTVHGKDNLDVTTFDLHAKTAVSLTQEAASDFIFAGIAGGLNNDDLAEINIKTGGGFSFTAS